MQRSPEGSPYTKPAGSETERNRITSHSCLLGNRRNSIPCIQAPVQKRSFFTEGPLQWAGKDLNLRRLSQRIYSPPPLATWVPAQIAAPIILIFPEMSTFGLGLASQEETPKVTDSFR